MTALERARQIADNVYPENHLGRKWVEQLSDAIHRAIIEHSNAELERRRALEAKVREFLAYAISGDEYRLMAISLSGLALSTEFHEHIRRYEAALKALRDYDA